MFEDHQDGQILHFYSPKYTKPQYHTGQYGAQHPVS